ncbi:histamine H2 receptor-like [Diadema antillarum]|uniref:histamine H2 receptor-like n=1 Tax=Diadema antillarum TaxID=105358 RepID=UPI003A886300
MANLTGVDLSSSSGVSMIPMVYASGVVVNILLICICNAVNLVVVPKLNDIKDTEKVFYLSLSITDLLVGITLLPLVPSAVTRTWIFGKLACNVHGILMTIIPICSTCVFVFLNLDRFVAIFQPMKYHQLVTKRRAVILLSGFALMVFTFLLICVTFVSHFDGIVVFQLETFVCSVVLSRGKVAFVLTTFAFSFWLPAILLLVGYIQIVRVAWQHVRKIHQAVTAPKTPDGERCARRPGENIPPVKQRRATGTKSIALMVVVTGSFSLCWLPFSIIESYLLIHPDGIPTALRLSAHWLPQTSSWRNAVTFLVLKKSYRQMVQKCFSCRQSTSD